MNGLTKNDAIEVIKLVRDPDLGIDLWSLGFIQGLEVSQGNVKIKMNLSCPGCPTAPLIVENLKSELLKKGFGKVDIELLEEEYSPSEEVRMLLDLR
jgi:ATP-binding protein involved in chromosome partitioning